MMNPILDADDWSQQKKKANLILGWSDAGILRPEWPYPERV